MYFRILFANVSVYFHHGHQRTYSYRFLGLRTYSVVSVKPLNTKMIILLGLKVTHRNCQMAAAIAPDSNFLRRSSGRLEVDHQGDGASAADRFTRLVRHHYLRHHRSGVLFGCVAQNLLQVEQSEHDGVQGRGPDTLRRRHERFAGGGQLECGQAVRPQGIDLPGRLGGPELRYHFVRQYRLGHADSLPVHHYGRLDDYTVLGKFTLFSTEFQLYLTRKVSVEQS